MSVEDTNDPGKRWTAAELRKLPPGQRDAILEAAAAQAEEEYRSRPELTAFEAFGKDDLQVESASTLNHATLLNPPSGIDRRSCRRGG
jgi:hypothetical protein